MAQRPELTLANTISAARTNTTESLTAPTPPSRPTLPSRRLQIFTDGSKRVWTPLAAGGAYTFFSPADQKWHGQAFALGFEPDSLIAELHAISRALEAALALLGRYDRFIIKSDSPTALNAVRLLRKDDQPDLSPLLRTIRDRVRALEAAEKAVKFAYVKGHSEEDACEGNRVADRLAGRASRMCEEVDAAWEGEFWVWSESVAAELGSRPR